MIQNFLYQAMRFQFLFSISRNGKICAREHQGTQYTNLIYFYEECMKYMNDIKDSSIGIYFNIGGRN